MNLTGIWVLFALMVLAATSIIVLRMSAQHFLARKIGRDDWCAILGFAFLIPQFVCSAVALVAAKDARDEDGQMETFLYYSYLTTILYNLSYTFFKVSVLLQYLRIFHTGSKRDYLWWGCWIVIFVVIVSYAISGFLVVFTCAPRVRIWRPWMTEGFCLHWHTRMISACVNAETDALMLALPQARIWSLQLSKRQRYRVSALFLVPLAATIVSFTRVVMMAITDDTAEQVSSTILAGIFAYTETMTVLACSSLPAATLLIKGLFGSKEPDSEKGEKGEKVEKGQDSDS